MHTRETLLDIHEHAHRNLMALLDHCRRLSNEQLHRPLDGFGYATVQLQLHHAIGAEQYWIGVLQGRIEADDDAPAYPTIDTLETYRQSTYSATETYLHSATPEKLNTTCRMMTWGNRERELTPAHVVMRTVTHLYHHQGQITAMCRLLGQPTQGLDYPLV